MTSFVNIKYSTQHPGVARVESALDAARQLRQGFSSTHGLATVLLSAIAAAVMVAAYQLMDSLAEGHLIVMWMALWVVAFTALVLFANASLNVAGSLKTGLQNLSASLADARADQRLWALAKVDARVMSDLQSAMSRQEGDSEIAPATSGFKAQRAVQLSSSVLRAYQRNYI